MIATSNESYLINWWSKFSYLIWKNWKNRDCIKNNQFVFIKESFQDSFMEYYDSRQTVTDMSTENIIWSSTLYHNKACLSKPDSYSLGLILTKSKKWITVSINLAIALLVSLMFPVWTHFGNCQDQWNEINDYAIPSLSGSWW